jgi:RND family efflux transporter MFP subunit
MVIRTSRTTYVWLCILFATIFMWGTVATAQQKDIFAHPFDCVIYPSVVAELGSSVAGVLGSVNVERSQLVKRGELVAQLESKAEKAALELVQARVDSTLEIDFRYANASLVERQFKRMSEPSTKDIFSREELDARKTDANMSQIQLAQAEENKRFLKLELEQANELLERRSILSPINGVVTDQLKFVGEFVDGEAVVRVAQLDPLHVETIIPAKFIGEVASGMQATIRSFTDSNAHYNAQVDLVDRVVDVASGTFGVRLILANPDYAITAGLRCSVQFAPPIQSPAAALALDESVENLAAALPVDANAMKEEINPEALSLENTSESDIREVISENGLTADQTIEVADLSGAINECEWPKRFSSREAAQEEMGTQAERGVSMQMEEQIASVAVGHTVSSPIFYDKTAAIEYVDSLNQKSIRDVSLSSLSNNTIRVSLGAYKIAEDAQARLEYVLQQGVEAQIIPWTEDKTEFVVSAEQQTTHSNTDCVL